ncbi:hypothetical protein SLA2020_112350 [Shorea laevis]
MEKLREEDTLGEENRIDTVEDSLDHFQNLNVVENRVGVEEVLQMQGDGSRSKGDGSRSKSMGEEGGEQWGALVNNPGCRVLILGQKAWAKREGSSWAEGNNPGCKKPVCSWTSVSNFG